MAQPNHHRHATTHRGPRAQPAWAANSVLIQFFLNTKIIQLITKLNKLISTHNYQYNKQLKYASKAVKTCCHAYAGIADQSQLHWRF